MRRNFMFKQKIQKMNWLTVASLIVLITTGVQAQQILPANIESEQLSDAIAQTNGEFDSVNLNYIHSLGMQQKAWNDPMAHLGEGQSKPGYSKYTWSPDIILPVRLREGMMTLINLPTWELIEKVHIGSPESFGGEIAAPNSLLVYADPSYLGVDSNMIIFGRSGNRYVFYLRSETYNTEKITQSVVDILVGQRYTPVEYGGKLGNFNGATTTATGMSIPNDTGASGWMMGRSGGQNPQISLNTASTNSKDWLKNIPVDPENIRFDIDMYIPNPSDVDIAPDNVWRDNIFTYIDLGPKALTMTQRPIVNLIVQDTEVPVGFRASGPNSRLIIVEAIGDLVLRNGKKIVCLKLRRDPSAGLEYTDYTGSQNTTNSPLTLKPSVLSEEAPSIIPGEMGGNGIINQNNVDLSASQAQPSHSHLGQAPIVSSAGQIIIPQQTAAGFYEQNMAPIPSIPTVVMSSPQASAGIVGVMNQMATTESTTSKTTLNTDSETISVELGTHADISELETMWDNIYNKNTDILSGYEPYYSIDTTADGNVRELFRLRIGPMKDVSSADKLCKKLGRRGFTCTVVRVQ